jgi:hypothetical protein
MYMLLLILLILTGVASLVCFILVLVKMFQTNQTTLGVVCIILTLCTGVGPLIGFIYGWIKVTEWNIKNVMLVWTGIFVLNIIIGIGFWAQLGSDVAKFGRDLQKEIEKKSR